MQRVTFRSVEFVKVRILSGSEQAGRVSSDDGVNRGMIAYESGWVIRSDLPILTVLSVSEILGA
jgi:hypothetical protein